MNLTGRTGIRKILLPFFDFATQLFSTPVTLSNLRNQAPLFTELRLLQATLLTSVTFILVVVLQFRFVVYISPMGLAVRFKVSKFRFRDLVLHLVHF